MLAVRSSAAQGESGHSGEGDFVEISAQMDHEFSPEIEGADEPATPFQRI
jgi:hypothetical protein